MGLSRTVSEKKRKFQSKIANFSHPGVFRSPLTQFSLELGIGVRDQKLDWWATRWTKRFYDRFGRL